MPETSKSGARISDLFYMDDMSMYDKSLNELKSLLNNVMQHRHLTGICLIQCVTCTIHRETVAHSLEFGLQNVPVIHI